MALAILLLLYLGNTGCSVGMASSGTPDPDMNKLKEGVTREQIESTFGEPEEIATNDQGNQVAIYEYEIGNNPDEKRAVAHFALDVYTLGLWEVVGTLMEAVKGDTYELEVTYDKNNQVINFKHLDGPVSSAENEATGEGSCGTAYTTC